MFKQGNSLNHKKQSIAPLQQFYGKMKIGFWFDTETHFITEIADDDR